MKKTKLFMDTVVEIKLNSTESNERQEERIHCAFEAFRKVEDACSRFSPDSELMRACNHVNTFVPISPFLYEPLHFALEMANWTEGLFDPTVGKQMEELGFNRHYLTRQEINSPAGYLATYRDIILNEQDRTLYLAKPLVIDLSAIAKGFAIDLAARELIGLEGFVVNAGGDLFVGGTDVGGQPWKVGIQDPLKKKSIIHTLTLSNQAICTSGNYERKDHLINPITNISPHHMLSASVIAPYAMMADAFATVSFLMTTDEAEAFVREAGLRAILITRELNIVEVGET